MSRFCNAMLIHRLCKRRPPLTGPLINFSIFAELLQVPSRLRLHLQAQGREAEMQASAEYGASHFSGHLCADVRWGLVINTAHKVGLYFMFCNQLRILPLQAFAS